MVRHNKSFRRFENYEAAIAGVLSMPVSTAS